MSDLLTDRASGPLEAAQNSAATITKTDEPPAKSKEGEYIVFTEVEHGGINAWVEFKKVSAANGDAAIRKATTEGDEIAEGRFFAQTVRGHKVREVKVKVHATFA